MGERGGCAGAEVETSRAVDKAVGEEAVASHPELLLWILLQAEDLPLGGS